MPVTMTLAKASRNWLLIVAAGVAGFAAGTFGSFIILFFYRLLAGTFFVESEDGERILDRSERARRRRLLREG